MASYSWNGTNAITYLQGLFYGTQPANSGMKVAFPYKNNPDLNWNTTNGIANVDATIFAAPSWDLVNDSTNQVMRATATITFTFTGAYAGITYYGIAICGGADTSLPTYYLRFPISYTVPGGGGSLVVSIEVDIQNC